MIVPFLSPEELSDFCAQAEGPFGFIAKMRSWAIFAVYDPASEMPGTIKRIPHFFKEDVTS